MKEKKNLVKMLSLLAMVFLVPKLVQLSIILDLSFTSGKFQINCTIYILDLLEFLIRCLNPVIYIVYSSNYREGAKRLFKSCLSR